MALHLHSFQVWPPSAVLICDISKLWLKCLLDSLIVYQTIWNLLNVPFDKSSGISNWLFRYTHLMHQTNIFVNPLLCTTSLHWQSSENLSDVSKTHVHAWVKSGCVQQCLREDYLHIIQREECFNKKIYCVTPYLFYIWNSISVSRCDFKNNP